MATLQKSIGLLGGSFNPVHNGHIAIVTSFLHSELIDELWILLTPDPPHKKEQTLADYFHRSAMLQAAFKGFENVKISDVEKNLPEPSYTIQTLEHLHKEYPNYNFYLCMGGDSLHDFTQWKDWQKILSYCDLIVARRPSADTALPANQMRDKVHFVDHEPIAVSSSAIRKRINEGKAISSLVPKSTEQYIKKHNLYHKA